MGAHLRGERAAGVVEVRRDHQRGAGRPKHAHRKAADRSAPEDECRASGNVAALECGVHRVSDRIHDGADLSGDAIEVHHVGGGHRDILGERSVAVDADDRRPDAEMAVAGSARHAVAANDVAFGRDEVAHRKEALRPGFRSHVCDLAREFVTDDHRGTEPACCPRIPFPDVQIGAAQTGRDAP